jgi:glycosyltransferase involved in cell wall biosynthesis
LQQLCGHHYNKTIFFKGEINNSDVPDVLRRFDVFVIPSRSESFGVAAVEASSVGLPVIASNVGGLPEVVIDGETGLLFESENVNDLCDKLYYFYQNPKFAGDCSERGSEFVRRNFDWHTNLSQLTALYDDIIRGDTK